MSDQVEHINYKMSNLLIEYAELDNLTKYRKLAELKKKFRDEDFKYEYSSFYNNNSYRIKDFEFVGTVFNSMSEKNDVKLFGDIKPENINLGKLPCNSLINSLKVLAERPYLIKRLFEFKYLTASHSFGIWLNVEGKWRLTVVDDIFPYTKEGNLVFSRAENQNIAWLPALEKGLAKQRGTYSDICNNNIFNSMFELTGYIPNTIKLNGLSSDKDTFEKLLKLTETKENLFVAYKNNYLKESKLQEIEKYEMYYIVRFEILSNKNGDPCSTVTLRKIDDLKNYGETGFENKNNREITLDWASFKNEFNEIAYWYINPTNAFNSVSYEDRKYSVSKLFVLEPCKLQLNLVQETFELTEKGKGINDSFCDEEKEIKEKDEDLKLIVNELDKNETNNNFNPSYRKPNKVYPPSESNLIIAKLIGDEVEEIYNGTFNKKFHKVSLDLECGNYIVVTKTNWRYLDKLNYNCVSFDCNNIVDIAKVYENDENIYNQIESESWKQKLNSQKKLIKSRDRVLFEMGNEKISIHEYFLENENCHVFEVVSEVDNLLKVKLKSVDSKNCVFIPSPNYTNKKEIIVETSSQKNGLIIVRKNPEMTEEEEQIISLEFQGIEYMDDEDNNNNGNYLDSVNSLIKRKDESKHFYLNVKDYEAGCGCTIF